MPATRVQRCCSTSSILPKGEKIIPDVKKILENMKYLDLFVIRKQITKRIPLVFIKTQQNYPISLLCGSEDSRVGSMQDDPGNPEQAGNCSCLPGFFKPLCLLCWENLPNCWWQVPPSEEVDQLQSCVVGSQQHNTSPICCNSLELPSASGGLFLTISPWVWIKLPCYWYSKENEDDSWAVEGVESQKALEEGRDLRGQAG